MSNRLRDALSWVPDLPCAWQILLQCASQMPPLAPHTLEKHECHHEGYDGRFAGRCRAGDVGSQDRDNVDAFERVGFTICKAEFPRCLWADALHMVSQRLPEVANDIATQLTGEPEGSLAELQGREQLEIWIGADAGAWSDPVGNNMDACARPPVPELTESGVWLHGWQHHESSFFRVPSPGNHGATVVCC